MSIKIVNPQVVSFSPVSTAEVGQTIKVKTVDENNKPTEWEAVDFPSGGGLPVVEIHTQIFPQGEGEYIELTADEMAALSAAADTYLPAIIKMYNTNVGYRANIFDFTDQGQSQGQGAGIYMWVLSADGHQSMYGFIGGRALGWVAMCVEVDPDE